MTDVEYMSIIVDVQCPGRGKKPCGNRISHYFAHYVEPNAKVSLNCPKGNAHE
jgi:hypothetical protein